jgi:hypothetical protein
VNNNLQELLRISGHLHAMYNFIECDSNLECAFRNVMQKLDETITAIDEGMSVEELRNRL